MYVPTLAVREQLDKYHLTQLIWIDTLDMLSDGLTKGEVDREALIKLSHACRWKITGLQPVTFKSTVISDSFEC